MKMFRHASLITAMGLILSPTVSHAAAFQLYELGTPIVGTAGVGQAALAGDASTAYFNPAAMTALQGTQFMLGSQMLLPYTNFSQKSNTTISGDNGGNAAGLAPGLDMYYVYSYSPRLKMGLSLTSPYGGSLNYNDGWVGRYVVQNVQFYTINLNPSIAWQFNQYVSAGMGLVIEYSNLQETLALPLPGPIYGQAKLKVDNTAAGANFGIYVTPSPSTQLGLAYRSRVTHSYTGSTTFLRISTKPNTSTQMIMPQNIIMSVSEKVTNRFKLLGELGWANWSVMKDTIVSIDGYSASIPRDWNDTYRLGLGGQFAWTPAVLLQAGISYDSSPTNTSHRLPDLPMDRQIRVGAGLEYHIAKSTKIGFSYEYINFGNANISDNSSNGMLAGSYSRNYGNVFQVSVNVDC